MSMFFCANFDGKMISWRFLPSLKVCTRCTFEIEEIIDDTIFLADCVLHCYRLQPNWYPAIQGPEFDVNVL